jgi:hypothetical protein
MPRSIVFVVLSCLALIVADGTAAQSPEAAPPAVSGWDHLGVLVHSHNDYLIDGGRDRWRTGGATLVQFLRLAGAEAELRLRGEFITPWNSLQAGIDRPPAAIAGAALLAQGHLGGAEIKGGLEVLHVSESFFTFQSALHDFFSLRGYDYAARGDAVADRNYVALHAEVARVITLPPNAALRPFAAFEAGFENYSRVGVDLAIGQGGFARLSSRDPVSGLLVPAYRPAEMTEAGAGFVLTVGGDLTRDHGSNLYEKGGVLPMPQRMRLRLGLARPVAAWTFFAGVVHLSPEFEGQLEPQSIGMLALARTF